MSITHGSGEYRDYKYKNKYNIPILWQRDMPLVNSSKIKQESLLDNMIFIRGISAPNPDHLSSRLATISPNNEVETIAGILMENASEIIPAVQYDQVFHHKSKIGQGAIITGGEGTNFASTLLSSFNSSRVFEKFMTNDNLEKMIESLTISLNNETVNRTENDNLIKMSIYEESATRAEKDAEIRIKLANASADRAEDDSKLSQRISNESSNRANDTSELKMQINKLECEINKLENCMKEEECSCYQTKSECYCCQTKSECYCCQTK